MTCSYTAYIDESGDEGFKFLPNGAGSSRWFVISAAVYRQDNALAPVETLKRARHVLGKDPKTALHFRNLRHEHRVAYVEEIAKEKMLTVSVAVFKPNINEPERYQEGGKYLLYKYVTRLLLERASWLCKSHFKGDGDGKVDLVFSDRAAMSYEDLKKYLDLLKSQAATNDRIRIDWSAIDTTNIRAVNHGKLAGLQVADAVASSLYYALNPNPYGGVEPRYATILKPHVFRGKSTRHGYGLKFWPNYKDLKGEMPHLAAFQDW